MIADRSSIPADLPIFIEKVLRFATRIIVSVTRLHRRTLCAAKLDERIAGGARRSLACHSDSFSERKRVDASSRVACAWLVSVRKKTRADVEDLPDGRTNFLSAARFFRSRVTRVKSPFGDPGERGGGRKGREAKGKLSHIASINVETLSASREETAVAAAARETRSYARQKSSNGLDGVRRGE